MHRLVALQGARHPDEVAITSAVGALSYRALNERADSLAGRLRAMGVGPEAVVGLAVRHSLAMAVGSLGILKAGGAYLPLDPAGPSERVAAMLTDADVRVLVVAEGDTRPAGSRPTVVLDAEGRLVGPGQLDPVPDESAAEDLAYVIYTSGSTGRPKGVQVTHGNLMNLVTWHQHAFGVTAADRATQLTSVGFDAAVWELWPYLAAGASVHVVDDACRTDPSALSDWLRSHHITMSFVPTMMAERLMNLAWPADAALRILLTGADALRRYPPAGLPFTVVNNYGPTECTVVATSGPVPPDAGSDRPPTIGRPIANTRLHILDEDLRVVPDETPGEIHIGGAGVARGYLGRPELTAERFIPDPFDTQPGARLYKTGDRGCLLPNGEIRFLGRIDDQIKIRGYRVEPGEIAFALNRHPAVAESLVVARDAAPGDTRLVAYLVLTADQAPTPAALRRFLEDRLPPFMLPAIFVAVPALPLNANGKVDRAALPAPDAGHALADAAEPAAGTPLELQVAAMLAELLGVDRVGMSESFFHLGGHSLLAAQVIARVNDRFGVELSLRSLFDHPTATALADQIERLVVARVDAMSDEDVQATLAEAATEAVHP